MMRVSLLFVILAALCGCGWTRQAVVTEYQSGDRADLVYQTSSPSKALGHVTPVSLEESGASLWEQVHGSRWQNAELRVTSPHPDGRDGLVKVTLELRSAGSPEGSRIANGTGDDSWWYWLRNRRGHKQELAIQDELWTLDLPAEELATILEQLDENGYFSDQKRLGTGRTLFIQRGTAVHEKEWSSEPVLERLITRVHSEGRLAGFTPTSPSQSHLKETGLLLPTENPDHPGDR